MIVAPLAGMALVVTAALGPALDPDPLLMSNAQKSAAIQPLVQHATECIARSVTADPRYRQAAGDLADMIVDSIATCIAPIGTMIERYDVYYGEGTGEAFFMGPYLELLPSAVSKWVKDRSAHSLAPLPSN